MCSVWNIISGVTIFCCMNSRKSCYTEFICNQTTTSTGPWRKYFPFKTFWREMKGTYAGMHGWLPSCVLQLHPIYPFLSSSFCFQAFIVIKRNGMKRYSPFLVGQVTAIRCFAPLQAFFRFSFFRIDSEVCFTKCVVHVWLFVRFPVWHHKRASPETSDCAVVDQNLSQFCSKYELWKLVEKKLLIGSKKCFLIWNQLDEFY